MATVLVEVAFLAADLAAGFFVDLTSAFFAGGLAALVDTAFFLAIVLEEVAFLADGLVEDPLVEELTTLDFGVGALVVLVEDAFFFAVMKWRISAEY